MAEVRILQQYCKGCGLCIDVCPSGCLSMGGQTNEHGIETAMVVEGAGCSGCLQCHTVCPDAAIEIYVARSRAGRRSAAVAGGEGGADDVE